MLIHAHTHERTHTTTYLADTSTPFLLAINESDSTLAHEVFVADTSGNSILVLDASSRHLGQVVRRIGHPRFAPRDAASTLSLSTHADTNHTRINIFSPSLVLELSFALLLTLSLSVSLSRSLSLALSLLARSRSLCLSLANTFCHHMHAICSQVFVSRARARALPLTTSTFKRPRAQWE